MSSRGLLHIIKLARLLRLNGNYQACTAQWPIYTDDGIQQSSLSMLYAGRSAQSIGPPQGCPSLTAEVVICDIPNVLRFDAG